MIPYKYGYIVEALQRLGKASLACLIAETETDGMRDDVACGCTWGSSPLLRSRDIDI
jgi:hypothetical protein